MRVNASLRKKLLYATLLSIGLATASTSAMARTVSGGANMCEDAKAGSRAEVNREIGVIKSTHERAEMERSAHAECMKQINQIVGEQISKTDRRGGIFGILGQINKSFDIGGAVCTAIKDKMGDKYEEINRRIGQIDGLFEGASEIAKQGGKAIGCVDCTGSEIDAAIDAFIKKQKENGPNFDPDNTPPPLIDGIKDIIDEVLGGGFGGSGGSGGSGSNTPNPVDPNALRIANALFTQGQAEADAIVNIMRQGFTRNQAINAVNASRYRRGGDNNLIESRTVPAPQSAPPLSAPVPTAQPAPLARQLTL